jgi:membrane-associated protein
MVTDLVDAALGELADLPLWAVLASVCVVMALETTMLVGVVVPGDLVVLFAASSLDRPVELVLLVVAVMLGLLAGESAGYAAGRSWGDRVRRSRAGQRLGDERWDRAADYLQRRGGRAVFLARYLAAVHALTPLVAGTIGMRYRRFIAWCAAGGLTWSALYVGLGALAGVSYRTYAETFDRVTAVVVGALVGAGMFVGLVHLRNRGVFRRRMAGVLRPGDVLLVGVLVAAVSLGIATATEAGSRPPDPVGYAIGIAGVVALLGRRRWPVGVLVAVTMACAGYHLLDYPGGPPLLAVVAAIYGAAAAGHLQPALVTGGLVTGAGVTYRWLVEGDQVATVDTVLAATLLVVVALLGDAVRARRMASDPPQAPKADDCDPDSGPDVDVTVALAAAQTA